MFQMIKKIKMFTYNKSKFFWIIIQYWVILYNTYKM